jgi:diamine N-acetyltransferase
MLCAAETVSAWPFLNERPPSLSLLRLLLQEKCSSICFVDASFSYALRACVPGDEEALSLLGSATFLETYSGALSGADIVLHCRRHHAAARYAEWLRDTGYRICVAEFATAPVGYAMLSPPDLPVEFTARDMELKRIYLLYRFQGAGVGRALMEWSLAEARARGMARLLLGVKAANEAALAFYARHGFTRIGARKFQVGAKVCDDHVLARAL